MMGHGKHHNCAMCRMARAIGMLPKCTDKNCTNPMHKKEEKKKEQKK